MSSSTESEPPKRISFRRYVGAFSAMTPNLTICMSKVFVGWVERKRNPPFGLISKRWVP